MMLKKNPHQNFPCIFTQGNFTLESYCVKSPKEVHVKYFACVNYIAYIIKMLIPGFGEVYGCMKTDPAVRTTTWASLTPAQLHPAVTRHGQQQLPDQ